MVAWLKKNKELILYVVFGGLTTLVNILLYYLCTRLMGINEYAANSVAWTVSVLFAFVTNKIWVFESRSMAMRVLLRELLSFVAARLLSLLLDMGILYLGIDVLHMDDLVVKIVSNILVILFNYIASRFFIFKRKGESKNG